MSGFAVLLDFSERLVHERDAPLAAGIAYRGPHRQATRVVGPCSLMHAALWTTPEAKDEEQPQRHVIRDFWLAADARVDNRDELIAALRSSTRQPLHTDADLILAAYERWGEDLVNHVVGDFGFALWDGEREELLIARDPLGLRPVFLARTPTGVVVASTLPAVLAGIEITPRVDETYLAGFIHGAPPRNRSAWAGVERLAPGHRRIVGRDRDATEQYWSPNLEPLVQPLEVTVELVRHLFDEAVRCRLRTRDGVTTDLSGGLDSSTVTATAAELTPGVQPISLVYRIDPEAFELPYMKAVADHLGLETFLIEADDLATLDPASDIRAQREPLYAVDASDTAACYDAASTLGCSVSLTGVGGDELLYGTANSQIDQIRQTLRGAALRWGATRPDGLFNQALRARRVRRARRDRPWLHVPYPHPPIRVPSRDATGAARLSTFETPWKAPSYELTDRLAAERSVEVRYPFLDRRLVEAGLRLPEAQIRADSQIRGLHRRSFGDRLPPMVTSRTDKANLTRSSRRRIDAALDADVRARAVAALGDRVDPARLSSGLGEEPPTWHLWLAISAGLFLSDVRSTPQSTGDTIA
jgi:asparagine synthase (glutamine-hydrolysing)